MKTMTINLAVVAALAIGAVATISNNSVSRALADAEGFSQTAMQIDQITTSAKNLPAQSFDAF